MASYLKSSRDFLYNRRKPFIVVGGIVGGVYMVAKYAVNKLTEVQTRMVEERRDRDNLRRRFTQNQEDCNFTILALLPTLGDQLFSHMDVEGLTAKLQKGRQSPAGHRSATPAIVKEDVPAFNGDNAKGSENYHTEQVKESESAQVAMEEIWNKLGSTNGAHHEAANSVADGEEIEAPRENGQREEMMAQHAEETTPAISNADGGSPHTPEANSSTTQALDSFSQPVPLPIRPDARLTPSASPTQTPDAREEPVSELVETHDEAKSALPSSHPAQSNGHSIADTLDNHTASLDQPPVKVGPSAEEVLAEKREKLALWNELKITAFSRTLTTLYSLVLLSLQTHVQLNLLGRYAYLSSVASLTAPDSSSAHRIRLERNDGQHQIFDDDDDIDVLRHESEEDSSSSNKGVDVQTERLYLTFSWWFLHQGWKELADSVKEAVEDVFGDLALKTQLTHQDFLLLLNKVRRRVECEAREDGAASSMMDVKSEWSEATTTATTTPLRRTGKRKTFLSILFPPSTQEVSVLESAGAISHDPTIKSVADLSPTLVTLLDETKDILESKDFARVLRLSLNSVFTVFEETLRPTFGVEPAQSTAAKTSATEVDQILLGGAGLKQHSTGRFQELTDDGHAGVRVRLASLFPAVARQSSAAINSVPNEYVEALNDIKELKALSAIIYSSWS
ncbi:hypothetical protein CBS101457_005346 [Exobasidium rhododendri]|nr:hypothetical protein CBS101457_005346 [Exobasidium rhododendri]